MLKTHHIVIYKQLVLDVSSFNHPGGHRLLLDKQGEDITNQFHSTQHSFNAKLMIKHYAIGRLCSQECVNELLQ
jgi:cytochrome b involved in lipid metabolism